MLPLHREGCVSALGLGRVGAILSQSLIEVHRSLTQSHSKLGRTWWTLEASGELVKAEGPLFETMMPASNCPLPRGAWWHFLNIPVGVCLCCGLVNIRHSDDYTGE